MCHFCIHCVQDLGESEPAADGLLTLRLTVTALGATDCFEKLDVTFDVPQLSRQRRRALAAAAAGEYDSTSMVSSNSSDNDQQRSLLSFSQNATDYPLVRACVQHACATTIMIRRCATCALAATGSTTQSQTGCTLLRQASSQQKAMQA
jgi:hypothetical protein